MHPNPYIPGYSSFGGLILFTVLRKAFLCLVLIGSFALPTFAQGGENTAPRVTLEGWVHDLRVAAWDRAGSAGGRYYDRGVFRYRTPRMDHEYDLDQFTAGFTLAEDAEYYAHKNGLRSHAMSVTTSDFITRTQLRASASLGEHIGLRIETDLQDDFEGRRLALRLGYEVPVGERHTVGFAHSLAREKADLDLGFYYRYQNENDLEIEAELVALDGLNNVIDGLKASPFNRDTLRHYETAPYMISARISSPILRRVRGEASFGIQNRSVATIRSLSHDSLRFTFEDSFWYAGALLEVDAWPGHVTTGAVAQLTSSTTTLLADADVRNPANYTTKQPYSRFGGFALSQWGRLHAEAWLYFDHYKDEQKGSLFGGASVDGPYLFEEIRTWIRAKAGVLTPLNLDLSLSYQGDIRRFPNGEGLEDEYYAFIQHSPNHRVTLNFSYRFSEIAAFDGGLTFDLDNDHFFIDPSSRSRYDGTYLRLRANW